MLISVLMAIALLCLSYMLVLSASHKLGDPVRFQRILVDYDLLPPTVSRKLSRALPVIEISIGLGLLVAPMRSFAIVAAGALLLTYTLAMAINIVRGRRDVDCGCHGPQHSQTIGFWSVGRNVILLCLMFGLWKYNELLPFSVTSWGVALCGTVLVTLFFHAFSQLQINKQLISWISHHG